MKTVLTILIFINSCLLSCKTIHLTPDSFNINYLSAGDSVLFKRGERYFVNIDLTADSLSGIRYFGAYGDTLLPKPILDGSIYRFDFNASEWDDFEVINGVKFYKKTIEGLEQVENVYAGINRLTLARKPNIDEEIVTGQKNSFAGYFKIDSVDVKNPRKVFFDLYNKTDWTGAEVVTKTQQWSYEVRKVENDGVMFSVDDPTVDAFRKNNGYFIQRHKNALDSEGEWYYDEKSGILYFSPLKDICTIYISSNRNNNNSGFDVVDARNIIIESLEFVNYKHGIRSERSVNVTVRNCTFRNSTYGILIRDTYADNFTIEDCTFINLHSYGIRLRAHNTVIQNNYIDSIGLVIGAESRGFNNLNGIEIYGTNNLIYKNTVKNTGYCGIRIFNASGTRVVKNHVENTMLAMSDGGGIYSYHSSQGNKLIRGNTVINAFGNAAGTQFTSGGSPGIYLDELSLHFRLDSNYVKDCGVGIYIQNSRSDTLVSNTTKNSRLYELHINSAGSILNGGKLNPSNDPGFNPDTLSFIPEGYVFDRENRIIRHRGRIIYVEPGNNFISRNRFYPDRSKYTFNFRTWRHIGISFTKELTGNSDFFRDNVPEGSVSDASVFIVGGNVRDMSQGGKNYDNIENTFDQDMYDFLRRVFIYIGRGQKRF